MSYVTSSYPQKVLFCKNPESYVRQLQIRVISIFSREKIMAIFNLRDVASSLGTRPSILVDWINDFVELKTAERPPDRPLIGRSKRKTPKDTSLDSADFFSYVPASTLSLAIESVIRKYILCPKCQGLNHSCGCTLDAPEQKNSNCRCDACDLMTLGTRTSCCWCTDTRSNEEINDIEIRLDAHGYVQPRKYYIYWPIDAAYCSTCRTCAPSTELNANLSSALTAFSAFTTITS